MHVIFVPYSLMKVDPASWMKMVTRFKGKKLKMNSCSKSGNLIGKHKFLVMFCSYISWSTWNNYTKKPILNSIISIVLLHYINIPCEINIHWYVITATIGVVKSRDMHWGLLAQRDHKDINLSSLRMLLVADGANPCTFVVQINWFYYICNGRVNI